MNNNLARLIGIAILSFLCVCFVLGLNRFDNWYELLVTYVFSLPFSLVLLWLSQELLLHKVTPEPLMYRLLAIIGVSVSIVSLLAPLVFFVYVLNTYY